MESLTATKKTWTYQDYLRLDDDKRYEIINGELIMTPSPLSVHQRILVELTSLFHVFVRGKNLGTVFCAPTDVVFSEKNIFQPDILFISKENQKIIKEKNIEGAPDLIVEILSPSTALNDLTIKKDVYQESGVKELWYVSPDEKSVVIYQNSEKGFKQLATGKGDEKVQSKLLEDFSVQLKELFPKD
ncbi:MAG TPA: Uma2 family endonuclease [Caldithrix sp.]|nr:Uma2 family endonuclease [Caldithrix sp.]